MRSIQMHSWINGRVSQVCVEVDCKGDIEVTLSNTKGNIGNHWGRRWFNWTLGVESYSASASTEGLSRVWDRSTGVRDQSTFDEQEVV
jgi:hypothetical protein